jgi:hypothetical protein
MALALEMLVRRKRENNKLMFVVMKLHRIINLLLVEVQVVLLVSSGLSIIPSILGNRESSMTPCLKSGGFGGVVVAVVDQFQEI